MRPSLLVLGGARSGKSREAQRLAESHGRAAILIATAEPRDDEMAARIARHRAERKAGWTVIEEPLDLAGAISARQGQGILVVDCLTLWLSNQMETGRDVGAAIAALEASVAASTGPLILVSNETGLGIVPATPLGREFRDAQGLLNQRMAECCEQVVFMVAGLPFRLKPAPLPHFLNGADPASG